MNKKHVAFNAKHKQMYTKVEIHIHTKTRAASLYRGSVETGWVSLTAWSNAASSEKQTAADCTKWVTQYWKIPRSKKIRKKSEIRIRTKSKCLCFLCVYHSLVLKRSDNKNPKVVINFSLTVSSYFLKCAFYYFLFSCGMISDLDEKLTQTRPVTAVYVN